MHPQTLTLSQQLQQCEKDIIIEELKRGRMMYQTAEALGIKYCTLWRKMRQHGITGAWQT